MEKNFLITTGGSGGHVIPATILYDHLSKELQSALTEYYVLPDMENYDDVLKAVGFFTLAESFSIFAHGNYGIINEFWIAQKHRGTGVGQSIINEIQTIGKSKEWKRIDVTAPASSDWGRTFEFYKKCGFELTGKKLKLHIN